MGLFARIKRAFRVLLNLDDGEEYYSLSLYKPSERMIYRYFDGQKNVEVDPMIIFRAVSDHKHELSVDMKVSSLPMKGNIEAYQTLLNTIRKIFNVKPHAEGGLTEIETVALLDHWLVYEDTQKKITNPLPTTPEEIYASSSPCSEGSHVMSNTSELNSTATASSTSEPVKSPTEPALPSETSTPA